MDNTPAIGETQHVRKGIRICRAKEIQKELDYGMEKVRMMTMKTGTEKKRDNTKTSAAAWSRNDRNM